MIIFMQNTLSIKRLLKLFEERFFDLLCAVIYDSIVRRSDFLQQMILRDQAVLTPA